METLFAGPYASLISRELIQYRVFSRDRDSPYCRVQLGASYDICSIAITNRGGLDTRPRMTWPQFKREVHALMDSCVLDAGYGGINLVGNLVIVISNGQLPEQERMEAIASLALHYASRLGDIG